MNLDASQKRTFQEQPSPANLKQKEKAMTPLISLTEQFEQASSAYAAANSIERTDEWFVLKMQEELGELTQMWMKWAGHGRPKGLTAEELHHELSNETADLLGHILIFARQNKVDLAAAIRRKWRFDPEAPPELE